MHQVTLSDPRIRGERIVSIASPSTSRECLIFLDGELYLERVGAAEIVKELMASGKIPSVSMAFLSYGEPSDRATDFTCRPSFSAFLADRLIPFIESESHSHDRYILCGLSLSGLAAAFAASEHPSAFRAAICQSPSAWLNDEWLTATVTKSSPKIYVSVGREETQTDVDHGPGLFQRSSQMSSCERLADRLNELGYPVQFRTFDGGHDGPSWGRDLPDALAWTFATR